MFRHKKSPFISKAIKKLENELEAKGFYQFKPHYYLGDEWFSPEGCPVSIPFFLLTPDLRQWKKKTGEAEGETTSWFMRTLRHEVGHCIF